MNTALGIKFTGFGNDYLAGSMPVNQNTVQPLGMLNGGASLAFIETLGSMAANMALDREKFVAVGQNVNASHFKPAMMGDEVTGIAKPLHIGKSSQVWEVTIERADGAFICKGTITMAVLPVERIRG
jgi:1,4-dihydroxy-2-naphthoyl-CoA hydrolase